MGIAFELTGILAVFTGVGVVIGIALSVTQELWIVATALAFWRSMRGRSAV